MEDEDDWMGVPSTALDLVQEELEALLDAPLEYAVMDITHKAILDMIRAKEAQLYMHKSKQACLITTLFRGKHGIVCQLLLCSARGYGRSLAKFIQHRIVPAAKQAGVQEIFGITRPGVPTIVFPEAALTHCVYNYKIGD